MRTLIIIISLFATGTMAFAQLGQLGQLGQQARQFTTATTEDGRKILVFPDGTWKSAEAASDSSAPLGVQKSLGDSKTFVKAALGPFGVSMNQKKWKRDSAAEDKAGVVSFEYGQGDAYAKIMVEKTTVPLVTLKAAVLANAKKAAPDAQIIFEERRKLNGKDIMCLRFDGTVEKTPITYYGYYYGGPEGTLQVLTYTDTRHFNEYKADLEDFLNGTRIGE